jgi:hypothetical protein
MALAGCTEWTTRSPRASQPLKTILSPKSPTIPAPQIEKETKPPPVADPKKLAEMENSDSVQQTFFQRFFNLAIFKSSTFGTGAGQSASILKLQSETKGIFSIHIQWQFKSGIQYLL